MPESSQDVSIELISQSLYILFYFWLKYKTCFFHLSRVASSAFNINQALLSEDTGPEIDIEMIKLEPQFEEVTNSDEELSLSLLRHTQCMFCGGRSPFKYVTEEDFQNHLKKQE